MTDESRVESGLNSALHEYADDLHPDLDSLATSSRLAGTRMRRRRRLGGSFAVAASVAGVIGVASLAGQLGPHGAHGSTGAGFAGAPSAPAQTHHRQHRCGNLRDALTSVSHGQQLRNIQSQGCPTGATVPGIYDGKDETIHLNGWRQVGTVADDKQSLQGPHGAVADIVWRAAADYDAWVSSSDKGNDPGVWTSKVHDGVFVSIQAGQGTSDAMVQALGASLTWN
jgi:hypothetical protein